MPTCARLDGPSAIDEGNNGYFKIVLTSPAPRAMTFNVTFNDGTARRVGNVAGKENQDLMWNGYFIRRTVRYVMGVPVSTTDEKIYGWIPTDRYNWRPVVGPLDQSWDYTIYMNGSPQESNTVQVTVPAGATVSNMVEIRAWRELVTLDLFQSNVGYAEATENFSVTSDAGCSKASSILDRSAYPTISPLTLDLDGDGIEVTPATDSSPRFDLAGNGHAMRSGWTSDALLAFDANKSGKIESGAELFGGARGDGYRELGRFDTNRDGVVSAADSRFGELSVWIDADQDRVTDTGELRSLAAAGVQAISLKNVWNGARRNGNVLGETGQARTANGIVSVVDVYFGVRN